MKFPFCPTKRPCIRSLAFIAALSLAVSTYAQQVEGRVNKILSQMTLDEKLDYISVVSLSLEPITGVFNIKPIPRLGLPEIFGTDGTIGITGQGFAPGTRYPSGPLLASTWSPDRAMEEGIAQGREARARGIHEILGPGMDFYRTSFAQITKLNGKAESVVQTALAADYRKIILAQCIV
jgi:beta-glucosidase